MRKIYNAPVMRVAEIDTEALIAQSPTMNGIKTASEEITDDNMSGFSMDSKRESLWDNLW